MTYPTIEFLEKRIDRIETELPSSESKAELIREKKSHLEVIKKIRFMESNNIRIDRKVLTLPPLTGRGYGSYRLMIDNETDDPASWTVVEDLEGESAEFGSGDYNINWSITMIKLNKNQRWINL